MASIVPYSGPKLRKPNLLKDFLLDDFSSCSSNGFRSFPRRQCCTTSVRILLDLDLAKKKHKNHQIPQTQKSSSSPAKTMLQRASTAVYKAVKSFPFASSVKPRRAILPRSISRKLFKRSFWKKCDRKEIARWNTFHTVVETKSEPLTPYSPVRTNTAITNSKNKKSYGSSVSWTESEFTSSSSCSSGNSGTVNSSENEVVKNSEQVVKKIGKRSVGVIVGEAITSSDANCVVDSPKKQWPNQENKEQFSPVSVLDCPFDNDDGVEEEDEVSSAFKHKRPPPVEGTNHKLNKNLRRLESLSKLEPVALEKRIALAEFDNESVGSPLVSIQENFVSDNEEEYNKSGKKSEELLEQMKAKTPPTSLVLNSDNLFLDFFIEATCEDNKVSDCELLDLAKDWINGEPQEMLLGWEVQKNREVYIREMEKGGMWSNKLDEDRQEVALELEAEIFASLVNDLFASS